MEETLKNTAIEYHRLAMTETDGFYYGCLVGMRSYALLSGDEAGHCFIHGLVLELREKHKQDFDR